MSHLACTLQVESGPWHYDVVIDSCSGIRSFTKTEMINVIIC